MEPKMLEHLAKLQSYEHSRLLDVVDQLRALGLSNLLPLPQLIVCGDQSSGKSSVLEAISGVPFPKKDNLCTRFATEVILRRSLDNEETHSTVSIRPGDDRSETDKLHLRNFARTLSDVAELPEAVQTAKAAMGLGSQGSNAFSTDVLRLEVNGPRMPQLTIVDLPGLIHSENRNQTAEDVELVSKLVHSYMTQKRSIILAVVTAKNDIANQIVLAMARRVDPAGQRTLGIITKPDTVLEGSDGEKAYLELARNVDVAFKLGWHIVRNLDTNEVLEESQSRDDFEEQFFLRSNWGALGKSSWGAPALRGRLSGVLFDQISHELPQLMEEIEDRREVFQQALNRLGRSRETESEQRLYLIELNTEMYKTCRAGCDGNYDDPFFRERIDSTQFDGSRRIRAVLQNQSLEFANNLERHGARWKIADRTDLARHLLSKKDTIARVMSLLKKSRGRELPGTFNPMLISELFQQYSEPWETFTKQHVDSIWRQSSRFVEEVLRNSADETVAEMYARTVIGPEMDKILETANKALTVLFAEQSQHAMTYNHYYTSNVAALRAERQKKDMTRRLESILSGRQVSLTSEDIPRLVDALIEEEESNMDRATAEEVFDKMRAYYKVAIKRLIDNVPIFIIENVVVKGLLEMIQPSKAWMMDATIMQEIAGESTARREHRQDLISKVNILADSERVCKRCATQVPGTLSMSGLSEEVLSARETFSDDGSSEDEEERIDNSDADETTITA